VTNTVTTSTLRTHARPKLLREEFCRNQKSCPARFSGTRSFFQGCTGRNSDHSKNQSSRDRPVFRLPIRYRSKETHTIFATSKSINEQVTITATANNNASVWKERIPRSLRHGRRKDHVEESSRHIRGVFMTVMLAECLLLWEPRWKSHLLALFHFSHAFFCLSSVINNNYYHYY
jgi:hypothetical protein